MKSGGQSTKRAWDGAGESVLVEAQRAQRDESTQKRRQRAHEAVRVELQRVEQRAIVELERNVAFELVIRNCQLTKRRTGIENSGWDLACEHVVVQVSASESSVLV